MDKLRERILNLEEKERQLKEQKKKLLRQQSEKNRKARTRKLIETGALAETYFNTENLSEDDINLLFIEISNLHDVKNIIPKSDDELD